MSHSHHGSNHGRLSTSPIVAAPPGQTSLAMSKGSHGSKSNIPSAGKKDGTGLKQTKRGSVALHGNQSFSYSITS